jgi:1,4-alpha-glucan branching enzyme
MTHRAGENWQFEVFCPGAERVFLVREAENGATVWIAMHHVGRGQWTAEHNLAPGRYRFRYFRGEGTTYFNCGNYGLTGTRLGEPVPDVTVDELQYAVPA